MSNTQANEKLVYSVEEVATLLGLSKNPVYDAIREKTIPSIKIGRRILIPRAALEKMLSKVA